MDKDYMKEAAKAAHDRLPDNSAFILIVAPFGEDGIRRVHYASNMERESAINVLKEWLIKASGEEEWMKHIQ